MRLNMLINSKREQGMWISPEAVSLMLPHTLSIMNK